MDLQEELNKIILEKRCLAIQDEEKVYILLKFLHLNKVEVKIESLSFSDSVKSSIGLINRIILFELNGFNPEKYFNSEYLNKLI